MFNNELWQKPAGGAGGNFYTYQIANSFRWDSGYLKRTPGSAGNRQTWTFSCWIKQSGTITNSPGDVAINNNVEHVLGIYGGYETATRFKGYMAEVVFIDGTALDPTSFASEKNGVWIPDDVSGLTFGSQGYYLNFADASAPGNDVSGNNNDWTNVSLSTHDQMLDTPTFNSDSNGGNFATY